jgi:hypothetical protein
MASYQYIDHDGNMVLDARFARATSFSDGLAYVIEDEWAGYIDRTGKRIIDGYGSSFSGGRAARKIDGEGFGFIDPTGKLVIKTQFKCVDRFREGLCAVHRNDDRSLYNELIDLTGATAVKVDDLFLTSPSESLCVAASRVNEAPSKWGFVGLSGKWVIEPKYDQVDDFGDGLAVVAQAGQFFYIDKKGKTAFDKRWKDTHGRQQSPLGFSEGLAAVPDGRNVGYIDRKGSWAIPPQFDGAAPFSDGLAMVHVKKKIGFIDKTGKMVIEPQYQDASAFSAGLAPVMGKPAKPKKTNTTR